MLRCKMRTIIKRKDQIMMTLEQIQTALRDLNLSAVARATGVSYGSVYAIATEKNPNPTYKTVAALSNYLSKTTAAA